MKAKFKLTYQYNVDMRINKTLVFTNNGWFSMRHFVPIKELLARFNDATCVMYENTKEDLCIKMYDRI